MTGPSKAGRKDESILDPDEAGRDIKIPFIRETFNDLKRRLSSFEREIKISSSEIPTKADVISGLASLGDFYKLNFEYYKFQINTNDHNNFLKSVAKEERQEMVRQMNIGAKLSESFHKKIGLKFLNYTVEKTDKDSKIRAKLTEFTLVIVFLTWALVEIELLRESNGIDLFFFKVNQYYAALFFAATIGYYMLRTWRDSLER